MATVASRRLVSPLSDRLAAAKPPRDCEAQADARDIAMFLEGSPAGFTNLYQRHLARIHALIGRMVGPTSDRDDLVQLAFIRVYRALPSFRGASAFSTFLFRIAARVAYDYLARRKRKRPAVNELELDRMVDPACTPAQATQQRQELADTFAILASLKPKKRIAFVLVAVEELPVREVAEIVGASEAAVKQRVRHARRELQLKLDRKQQREDGR